MVLAKLRRFVANHLPIVLLILLIYNMKIEGIKKQLADMQDELDDLNDLKTARVVGIKEQLSNVQKQLDHMNSPETNAQRGRHREAREQLRLGWCYYYGDGVEKNLEKAANCFHKAAELGYTQAQLQLGECYANGWGVPKDRNQANYWYTKAAEQGNEDAKRRLEDSTAAPA